MEFPELAGMAGGHAEARAIQTALKLGMFEAVGRAAWDRSASDRAACECDGGAGAALD
jgi:hypothetical protein